MAKEKKFFPLSFWTEILVSDIGNLKLLNKLFLYLAAKLYLMENRMFPYRGVI